jgi:acetyl-CoA/propionyl-CoA carboxylase biotin carboxyl carrier protein
MRLPSGFGVRWDGGYEAGDEISQFYDNLVGKLVCWGADRPTAIARTLRALRELEIEGVATTVPADIAILEHPDFAAIEHSTKWVEEVLDLSGISSKPPAGSAGPDANGDDEPKVRRDVDVEVNGKRFKVAMWVPESDLVGAGRAGGGQRRPRRRSSGRPAAGGSGAGEVVVPMQGTVVKVLVEPGDAVEAGETVIVLEAMKMENNVVAEKSGTVAEVRVAAGDSVGGGDVVVVIS